MPFLTHYKRIIERSGPINKLSCFTPERKHQSLKRYMEVTNNRKDAAQSLSRKILFKEALEKLEN